MKHGKKIRKLNSKSAENMSRRYKREEKPVIKAEGKPTNYAEIAAKGPLAAKNQVIGVLYENGAGGILVPDPAFKDTNFGTVQISAANLNGAPFKMTVVCEILNPNNPNRDFKGKVIEVLGDMGNSDVRMLSVLRQYGLAPTFPDGVMDEVKHLDVNPDPLVVDSEIKNGRRDMRDLLTITIDGEEAKDLDDAISLEIMDNGDYKLYVHIADVSHYVRENTLLDAEAQLRATSVYLVDRVIPMLPPKLSNGLCSLNPNVDRLTMTAEMYVDKHGNTYDGEIYESVIKSDRRMSYNECYRILTEPQQGDEAEYGPIIPMLEDMKALADILCKMRHNKGAMDFEFPETKVTLDKDGKATDVKPYPINFCHGIIEQLMICANEFVAERFARMNYPFVYRIHEDPDALKMARFCNVARNFGATGKLPAKLSPQAVMKFKETIKDESAKPMLDTVLLRSMAKARYSQDNMGHFGLSSEFYCHFTSPIRRYPDLYIHRIIKSYIHEENKRRHFAGLVDGVAKHSSDMERNSIDAERTSVDIKVAEYMEDKVGNHYEGVVTSIIEPGIFIQLPSTVEGFIAFRTMDDHYQFDERTYMAIGARTGRRITIGMPVRVVVASVDPDSTRIDFVLEEGYERNNITTSRGKTVTHDRRIGSVPRKQLRKHIPRR